MSERGREWTEEEFLQTIETRCPEAVAPARQILDWAHGQASITVGGGRGPQHPSLALRVEIGGTRAPLLLARLADFYPSARLEVAFGSLKDHAAFADQRVSHDLYRRFADLGAFRSTRGSVQGWPTVPLAQIAGAEPMGIILGILSDMARLARG
jgi:hypothetical protein